MHDLSFPSMGSPTSPLPSPDLQDYPLDVLDKVVHGAIIAPSPFLSEGVKLIKEEPLEDDKLLSACVHVPSSIKRSLEDIYLLEFDGVTAGVSARVTDLRTWVTRNITFLKLLNI